MPHTSPKPSCTRTVYVLRAFHKYLITKLCPFRISHPQSEDDAMDFRGDFGERKVSIKSSLASRTGRLKMHRGPSCSRRSPGGVIVHVFLLGLWWVGGFVTLAGGVVLLLY